jgi:hypothetical protein
MYGLDINFSLGLYYFGVRVPNFYSIKSKPFTLLWKQKPSSIPQNVGE